MDQERLNAFVAEYQQLCRKHGLQIMPVDQRVEAGNTLVIKPPDLTVEAIPGFEKPNVDTSALNGNHAAVEETFVQEGTLVESIE